jgi:hypothetical protein
MSQVYAYIDENMKYDINVLTVSFTYSSDTSADDAIAQIDHMVSLADSDSSITFEAHEYDLYTMSPYNNSLVNTDE